MAVKANKAIIEVTCGDFKGYFYPSRFGPAGKSLCVKLDNTENSEWMTPVQFEKKAGKGPQHNWKRTVRSVTHDKKTMYKCIQEGIIKICPNQIDKFDKDCKCRPCMLSKGGPVSGGNSKSPSKSPESKVPAKKTTPIKNKKVSSTSSTSASTSSTSATSATSNTISLTTATTGESNLMKAQDTDSDSGISIEISTNTATSIQNFRERPVSITPMTPPPLCPPSPMILEPLTTEEQDKPMPNYTLMVQEAIISLTKGEKNNENFQGCSLLGIFLYILRQYPNTMSHDSVIIMNTKIRSTLALLKRMGIVKSINDEPEDLEIVSSLPMDVQETNPTATTKQELGEKPVKGKKESKPKQTTSSKSNSNTLKTTSISSSTEAAAKKKASKNLVKKAKVLDKNCKSPNSSSTPSGVKMKSSASKKPIKLKVKIKTKNGSGKENSNKSTNFWDKNLKLKNLSPALALICGKSQMSRHEAVREIWQYIKKQKLQDPNQKTVIFCDEKLKAVTKKKKVTCNEVSSCLSQNMTAI